jgi:hypothetical protein
MRFDSGLLLCGNRATRCFTQQPIAQRMSSG